jgi:hypothetical protein
MNRCGLFLKSSRSGVRLVTRQRCSHANHLHKSGDGTEDYSCEVKPVSMQPAVQQPAETVAEEDGRRDDESDLRVSRRGDERIWSV